MADKKKKNKKKKWIHKRHTVVRHTLGIFFRAYCRIKYGARIKGFKEEGSPIPGDTWASRHPSRETPTSLDALGLLGKMLLLLGHQLAALLPWSCSILEITQPSSPTTHHVGSKDGAGHVRVPVPGRQASSLLPVKLLSVSNSAHPYQQEKQLQAPFSKVFKKEVGINPTDYRKIYG